jgi:hypothetical protein
MKYDEMLGLSHGNIFHERVDLANVQQSLIAHRHSIDMRDNK